MRFIAHEEMLMVVVTGKYDGKQVILDRPPEGIAPNTRVRITLEAEKQIPSGLEAIVGVAKDVDLPPDFAAQHEHYTHGSPKR